MISQFWCRIRMSFRNIETRMFNTYSNLNLKYQFSEFICLLTRIAIQQGVKVKLEYTKRTPNPSVSPKTKSTTQLTTWMLEITFKSFLLKVISSQFNHGDQNACCLIHTLNAEMESHHVYSN